MISTDTPIFLISIGASSFIRSAIVDQSLPRNLQFNPFPRTVQDNFFEMQNVKSSVKTFSAKSRRSTSRMSSIAARIIYLYLPADHKGHQYRTATRRSSSGKDESA
jgi:hypothetical protein